MPVRKDIFPYLSYITASGDEVVLSCKGYKKWWECYGREGFFAPKLDYAKREYADGSTEVLSVTLKPRTLKVRMFCLGGSTIERDEILRDIASRLIQIGTRNDWGKLRVRRSDGKDIYIDCVYIGGMDEIVEKNPNIQQFDLKFFAGDSYFYDIDESMLLERRLAYEIYLAEDLYLEEDLYLTEGQITSATINNSGELFFPFVDVFGPALSIRIVNNTTGKTLGVDPSFRVLADQKLTFNCHEHERAITLTDENGVVTDVTDEILLGSSLVWEIVKGKNDITFYYSNANADTFARLRYRQRYYSI